MNCCERPTVKPRMAGVAISAWYSGTVMESRPIPRPAISLPAMNWPTLIADVCIAAPTVAKKHPTWIDSLRPHLLASVDATHAPKKQPTLNSAVWKGLISTSKRSIEMSNCYLALPTMAPNSDEFGFPIRAKKCSWTRILHCYWLDTTVPNMRKVLTLQHLTPTFQWYPNHSRTGNFQKLQAVRYCCWASVYIYDVCNCVPAKAAQAMLKTRTMSVSRMQGKSDKVVTVCLLYKSLSFLVIVAGTKSSFSSSRPRPPHHHTILPPHPPKTPRPPGSWLVKCAALSQLIFLCSMCENDSFLVAHAIWRI